MGDYFDDILKANMDSDGSAYQFTPHKATNRFLSFTICMINDHKSTVATRRVIQSIRQTQSELIPLILPATTPESLDHDLSLFGLTKANWTYPSTPGERKIDIRSGLTLTGYNANNIHKVMACMVSHMRLWQLSAASNNPIVVLEHDALFKRKFQIKDFESVEGTHIVGLNDPRGATRKSVVYYDKVTSTPARDSNLPHIKEVPYVDDDQSAPQGLAGNSAYLIYPRAAGFMLGLVKEYGLWPNDALMCKQLMPTLKHSHPFYTTLQGVASTTQG